MQCSTLRSRAGVLPTRRGFWRAHSAPHLAQLRSALHRVVVAKPRAGPGFDPRQRNVLAYIWLGSVLWFVPLACCAPRAGLVQSDRRQIRSSSTVRLASDYLHLHCYWNAFVLKENVFAFLFE